jgi:geranylgeranyl pyrophosphate synthase
MTQLTRSLVTIDPLPEPVQDALHAVETLMHDIVNSDVAVLRDASRHILAAGGKRVRPRLLLLAYAASGGEQFEKAIPVAAALELVHTASVVHDDINDHGVVRRGRPSVNSIWGRTFALLTGDFLFTKVYELMAPYKDLNIAFADATIALVEGETMQAAAVKENNFTRQTYYEIIARKTAALFRAGGALGVRLAGGTREQEEALAQYGFNIGLAFQIVDDVLDLIGDPDKLGKTSGIDLAQGRGYAAAYASEQDVPLPSIDEADPMVSIKRKVLKGDAIKEARDQAHNLVGLAVASLDMLPDSDAKNALIDLAYQVVEREF